MNYSLKISNNEDNSLRGNQCRVNTKHKNLNLDLALIQDPT
jgi:hypothetical protein